MNDYNYQQCTRCVMDTTAEGIYFNANGVCNYCTEFLESSGHFIHESAESKKSKLEDYINKVKEGGKNKPYDCIIGVSGGVDSSWVLVLAKKYGLRPLAVHMDNGWNSELAQNNIANLVKALDVDLYTHVIDWEEYRSLMQAFFDADVIDVELLYDNAMLAVNYRLAAKYGINHILSGCNKSTEGMRMPKNWNWFKYDKRNIIAIGKKFSDTKLKTFPAVGTLDFIYYRFIKNINWSSILDLVDYNKFEAMNSLKERYGYKPYPYKHYESIFTRFYQAYILPLKFNVDKRKIHLSTLILSGQISREESIKSLNEIPYPDKNDMIKDRDYFMKKMGWTEWQLNDYLKRPEVSHDIYLSEVKMWALFSFLYKKIKSDR